MLNGEHTDCLLVLERFPNKGLLLGACAAGMAVTGRSQSRTVVSLCVRWPLAMAGSFQMARAMESKLGGNTASAGLGGRG